MTVQSFPEKLLRDKFSQRKQKLYLKVKCFSYGLSFKAQEIDISTQKGEKKKKKKTQKENQISLLGDLILRSIIVILIIQLTFGLKYPRPLLLFTRKAHGVWHRCGIKQVSGFGHTVFTFLPCYSIQDNLAKTP